MDELSQLIERERASLRRAGILEAEIRAAVSPYRVCPIGAHVDHQKGPVLGMGIGLWSVVAFAPAAGGEVRATSGDFPGEERFDLRDEIAPSEGWGRYLRGAAWALRERLPERPRGLRASVGGSLPGGGLSSSASVLTAYLLALAHVNDVELSPEALVGLCRKAENEFVGVASGILDPASVVGARRGRLLSIDTAGQRWEPVSLPSTVEAPRILVAFTGTSRNLASTPFNARVAECRDAARELARLSGARGVEVLGDLDDAVFEAHGGGLSESLRRRARHFFGERDRVRRGVGAWREGDLAGFGRLMLESCRSSIECYETGSPEQIELQKILLETPGVLGARFSGAGFGGCSIALADPASADAACRRIEDAFVRARPELAGRARVFPVETEDGARLV